MLLSRELYNFVLLESLSIGLGLAVAQGCQVMWDLWWTKRQ
jgi:hypothetical protein